MPIVSNVQSLYALLSHRNELFEIPAYQRRYSWKAQQVYSFYNDINSLSNNNEDNDSHLFGMIILHTQEGGNKIEVVDGQQRLTTLTLLLKSIENAYLVLGDNFEASEIGRLIQVQRNGEIANKLTLGNMDTEDYCAVIANQLENIHNKRLEYAIGYFTEQVSSLTRYELDSLCNKILYNSVILRLDLSSIKDAYKVFETFNNRGLKLSATDLIKNLLLGQAAKINEGLYLEDVKNIWTEIIVSLDGLDNDDSDIFFKRYFSSLVGRPISKNKLDSEFKLYYSAHIADEFNADVVEDDNYDEEDDATNPTYEADETLISIVDFLEQIKLSAIEYRKLILEEYPDPFLNQEIKKLNSIQAAPAYIFLMQFMQFDEVSVQVKVNIIHKIAALMLRRHICKEQTGVHERIFANLTTLLTEIGGDNRTFVNAVAASLTASTIYPNDEKFYQNLLAYNFEERSINRALTILERHNYILNHTQLVNNLEFPSHWIIPRTISDDFIGQEWEAYLGEDAVARLLEKGSKIGNLTLLENENPREVAPNPYLCKRASFENSALELNTSLAAMANFKFTEIEERTQLIANTAVEYWRISNEDDEDFFLGLGGGDIPIKPENPFAPVAPDHGPTNLVLVPGTRQNLETSIEFSVDVEFAIQHLGETFVEELIEKAGGIYCWAVTKNSLGFYQKLKENDIVLISEKRTGKFTHSGKVVAKINSASFGTELWPVVGKEAWEFIYFLTDIRYISINKREFLNELGYDERFVLPGSQIVNEDKLANLYKRRGPNYIAQLIEDSQL